MLLLGIAAQLPGTCAGKIRKLVRLATTGTKAPLSRLAGTLPVPIYDDDSLALQGYLNIRRSCCSMAVERCRNPHRKAAKHELAGNLQCMRSSGSAKATRNRDRRLLDFLSPVSAR